MARVSASIEEHKLDTTSKRAAMADFSIDDDVITSVSEKQICYTDCLIITITNPKPHLLLQDMCDTQSLSEPDVSWPIPDLISNTGQTGKVVITITWSSRLALK